MPATITSSDGKEWEVEVDLVEANEALAESVYTLERLIELAAEKRALVCPSLWGSSYKPAAFIVNMTGMQIYKLFGNGLFVREKPTKTKKAKTLPKGWEQDFPGGLPPGNGDAAAK